MTACELIVFCLLLTVNSLSLSIFLSLITKIIIIGEIRPDAIRIKFLENVVEKRDKQGNFCYPKLKLKLTTCWGSYAWIKNSS